MGHRLRVDGLYLELGLGQVWTVAVTERMRMEDIGGEEGSKYRGRS